MRKSLLLVGLVSLFLPVPAHVFTMENKTESAESASTSRTTVTWKNPAGAEHTAFAGPELLDEELYLAGAIRTGNRYPGQRNYHGLHWFSNTGTHVWHESMFERQSLLWLDFTSDIVAIAAQPMRMDFTDGSTHFPDFIALHSDYRQVVYNVKPTRFLTEKAEAQFRNAAALCKQVGWGHEVISDLDPTYMANIEWLAHYRQPVFAPLPDIRAELLAAADEHLPIRDLAAAIDANKWPAVIAAIYHLTWHGELEVDLTYALTNASLIGKKKLHANA